MTFDPRKPYNDLPALPPQAEVESRAILKACIEARAAVAELKQAGELIPNQAELIDPLVRMAIGHYQFEAIHPFVDGNG